MIAAMSLIITVLAAGFVIYPLFRAHRVAPHAAGRAWEDLIAERDNLYDAIKDLEFDFLAGKIEQKDYESLRARFEIDAIDVLHQIDALRGEGGGQPAESPPTRKQKDRDELEAEIERYKRKRKAAAGARS